jgi:L-alanine-DL-glutamate epimerase-like enolase superfamily enzyme
LVRPSYRAACCTWRTRCRQRTSRRCATSPSTCRFRSRRERADSLYQFKQITDTARWSFDPARSVTGRRFTQVKKIAALAEAAMVGVFPHLMGSPVNIAAFVQLDAAIPNYVLHEAHTGADALNDILDTPLQRDGGYVVVPDRPGIGVEIREEMLARFPPRRHTIVGSFHEDGSVAH